jgi:hypothetical protein
MMPPSIISLNIYNKPRALGPKGMQGFYMYPRNTSKAHVAVSVRSPVTRHRAASSESDFISASVSQAFGAATPIRPKLSNADLTI